MVNYISFVETMPIKDSWLITDQLPAKELAKIMTESISELANSPPDILKDKKWSIVSHSLTSIESHLVLSYIFREEE
jgi:hypothetical protein